MMVALWLECCVGESEGILGRKIAPAFRAISVESEFVFSPSIRWLTGSFKYGMHDWVDYLIEYSRNDRQHRDMTNWHRCRSTSLPEIGSMTIRWCRSKEAVARPRRSLISKTKIVQRQGTHWTESSVACPLSLLACCKLFCLLPS